MKIIKFLKGKKTYLVAIATIIFAITGYYTKSLSADNAITIILGALGLSGLRDAIK